MKFFYYFRYLLRHKWFVMLECFKEGLYWRGIIHDLSKFLPSEFFPYMEFFYGEASKVKKSKTGYFHQTGLDFDFDFAWLKHQKRNDHHWQWWLLIKDNGNTSAIPMSEDARTEMICDWRGAGRAQGFLNSADWYHKNKKKIRLHPDTRTWVEENL